jgi:hypothetical protein
MENDFDFLEKIPKTPNGLFILYELFTFDNFFRLLLKNGLDHEETLNLILSRSSLNALVFQERIHNENYKNLSQEGDLPYECFFKAQLIYDLFFEDYGSDPEKR